MLSINNHTLCTIIATWFGSGLSPKAPGTAGSLAALPFAYVIHRYFGGEYVLCAAILLFFVGWWASNRYLQAFPDTHDPGSIVIDEVVGQWLLLSVMLATWQSYLVGFVLFRLFDVLKPWPISWADRKVGGGLGVMLDDVLAGLIPAAIWIFIWNAAWFAPVLTWMQGA